MIKMCTKFLILIISIATIGFTASAQCDHSIEIYDSYGDGWDGAMVDVQVNGVVVVDDFTITTGSFGSATFSALNGDDIDVIYTSGAYENEHTYEVFDGDGNSLGSSGPYPGDLLNLVGFCPPCDHSIELYDSYGDGWDGAMVDVQVNGVVVIDDFTFTTGNFASSAFSAASGDDIDVIYTSGAYENEHTYEVFDGNGTSLGSSGPYPGDLLDLVGFCPNCLAPTGLAISGETPSSADLSWTAAVGATGYNWEVVPAGNGQGVGVVASGNTANTYATASGLSAATAYDAYVQSDCGSTYDGPVSFSTPGSCGLWAIELYDTYGDGWNGGIVDVYVNGTAVLSGVTLATGNGPESHNFAVNIGDIVSIDYTAGNWSGENEYTVYDESSNTVAYEGGGGATPGDIGDYTIPSGLTACPACPDPTGLAVSGMTQTTADLSWNAAAGATGYNWEVVPIGNGQGVGVVASGNTANTFVTATGLTASTGYDAYVQNDCGSAYAGPVGFYTSCPAVSVPYFESFDAVTAPAFPSCMVVENTNADGYTWETNTTSLSAPNSARIRYNSTLAMDDWFFTDGLNLIGGVTYEVGFAYAAGSATWPENLSVDWGNAASSGAMSGTPIFTHLGIDAGWFVGNATFSPVTSGVYYVGFHGHSDADQLFLYVDDISVLPAIEGANLWTGTTDNNWRDASNWSGGIPTSGTDVTIPSGVTNYPTVSALSQCNSVYVASGASLLDNGLLLTSSATVDRDYSGNYWHLVSSPVTGVESSVFLGLYLQSHDESTNQYSYIIETDVPLTPGQGFALWNQNGAGPHTAAYTGSLTSSATRALTRSAAGADNGWNLCGNPFPSSIDWESAGMTKTNVSASTYCLDQEVSGNWAVWNGTVGTNGATQYIASGQGFFVAVNDDGSTTGSLSFTNSARLHHNTTFFKDEPADVVKLMVSGNGYSDETAVYFREEATVGFDDQMDAYEIPSMEDTAPYMYSSANEGMAINVLPDVTTVPMNVNVGTQEGTFTIETVQNGEFENLYLEDVATGTITDLNTDSYSFEFIPGLDSRFNLHFSPLSIDDLSGTLFNIYSYEKDVYVAVPENTQGTIQIIDLIGRVVESSAINNTVSKITLQESAYYVVVVTSNESVVTEKVFIK